MHGTSPDSGPGQISDEGSSAENLQIPERPQISDEGSNNLRNSESADSGTTHRLVTRAGPKICRFLSSGLLAVGRQTAKKSADPESADYGTGICRFRIPQISDNSGGGRATLATLFLSLGRLSLLERPTT